MASLSRRLPSLRDAVGVEAMDRRISHNTVASIESRVSEWPPRQDSDQFGSFRPVDYTSTSHAMVGNSSSSQWQNCSSTQMNSRGNLVNTTASSTIVYSSAPSPVESCHSPSEPSSSDTDDTGTLPVSKREKEKRHRALLQYAILQLEDIQSFYCGHVPGHRQSAGNAASSGLAKDKLGTVNGAVALLARVLDHMYKDAEATQTAEELKTKLRRWQTEWDGPIGDVLYKDPLFATLMHGTGNRCERGKGAKCAVHGEENWHKCRRSRVETTVKSNMSLFEQGLVKRKARRME